MQPESKVENLSPMPQTTHTAAALVCALEEIELGVLRMMIPPERVPMLLAVSRGVRDGLCGLSAHVHARADAPLVPMPLVLRRCVVTQMSVRRRRLTDCEAVVLADILARCTELEHLQLGSFALSDSAAQELWLAVKQCRRLESFAFECKQITSVSKSLLLTACRDLEKLARLNLRELKIGTKGAQTLATCLHKRGNLSHLDLSTF